MTKVRLLKTYPKEGGMDCLPLLLFGPGIIRAFVQALISDWVLHFWPHRCIMYKA